MKSGHWLLGLAAISGALAPSPVLGAEADLSVTLSLSSPKAIIAQGSSWNYTAVIKNAGPSHATKIQLNAAIPADLKFVGIVSGCTSHNGDGTLPCDVPDIVDGSSASVVFSVKWPLPKSVPAACPDSLGDASVTVTATTTDASALDNTATLSHVVVPYADLDSSMDAPATANVGDVVEFTVTIKNLGPCDSENVLVDSYGYVGQGLTFQSSAAPCANVTDADQCALGTMKVGDIVTFTKTYRVEKLPESLTSTGDPNGIEVSSDTFDPNHDPYNYAATSATETVVTTSSGCSASGIASPAIVLALAGLFAFRRRSART